MKHKVKLAALELCVTVAVFAGWWVFSAGSQDFYFPPLAEILRRFAADWLFAGLSSDVLPSLLRLSLGYSLAVAIGLAIGLALGASPTSRRAFAPTLEFIRATPPPALVPFAILVFGIGDSAKAFLIALGCIWPILLGTIDGVAAIDPVTRDTADAFGLRGARRLWSVTLPAASPRIAAGMRVSLSLAVILMVISEMVGSTNGIGYFIVQAQRSFAMADMWSGILVLGLLGLTLNLCFELLERRVLRWHRAAGADPRDVH